MSKKVLILSGSPRMGAYEKGDIPDTPAMVQACEMGKEV